MRFVRTGCGWLLLVATACDTPAPPNAVMRTDSAGVEIVGNGPVPVWGDEARTLQLALRIGVVDGDSNYQFHEIADIEIDEGGNVYVSNRGAAHVHVFDSTGAFVHRFGGRGNGPSDIDQPGPLWVHGDSLLVVDYTRGIHLKQFSVDGTLRGVATNWSLENPGILPLGWSRGELLAWVSEPAHPRPEPGSSLLQQRWLAVLDLESNTTSKFRALRPLETFQFQRHVAYGLLPLFNHTRPTDAGVLIGHAEQYRIDLVSIDGGVLRSVRVDVPPVAAGGALVQDMVRIVRGSWEAASMESFPPWMTRESALQQRLAHVEGLAAHGLPDLVPPIGGIIATPAGEFWVKRQDVRTADQMAIRFTPNQDLSQRRGTLPTAWDVFDATGRRLGQVEVHPNFIPLRLASRPEGPARAWGVEFNDDDVQFVAAYDIVD